nr:P1-P2 fusion protein [Wheat leaf yellowing-associated virus]
MARFTNGVWLCALICALLFQSYSCLEQPSTLSLYQQMGYSGSPSTYGWLDSNNITELLADVEGASFTINSPIDPLNLTYGELFGHLSYKVSNDLKELRKEVSNLLRQYSTSTFCLMSEYTKSFVESLLWTIIKLYLSSLGMMIYLMGMILRTTLWKPVLVCAFLAVVSTMTYWMLKKICSYIPLWWVGAPLIAPFMIIRWLASRLIRFVFGESSGDEKMVAGFKSFSVAMSPPGNSILEILHANDSHMGYATCVKLVNGEDALLTATHCCGPDMKIRSLRNGYKIPMREFQIMFTSQELDITILRGPPEWKSLLGAKAVSFTPVNQLNKGPVSLYTYEDGWLMHNAKVVGSDKKYASVLSNTEKGYSGTPYWNGKTVIGVHKGFNYGDSSKNYNLMAPIPPIKGLTAPAYVYESPALQGDAFSEQEIEEIADHAAEIYEKATSAYTWKPRDGKHWWEMVEEEEEFEAASNPSSLPIQGKRPAWRRPRRKTGIHPCQARRLYRNAQRDRCTVGEEHRHDVYNEEGGGETPEPSTEQSPGVKREEEIAEHTKDLEEFFQAAYDWEEGECDIPGFRRSGSLPALYYPPKPKSKEWGERVISEHPEMAAKVAGFGWPKFGAQAEQTSLRLQAARWLQRAESAKVPSKQQRKLVIDRVVKAYEPCKTNAPHTSSSGTLSWNNFLKDFKEAVNSLELDAGIGLPYKLLRKDTHRQMVEDPHYLPLLTRLTWNRLQKMSQVDPSEYTPEQLVKEGLCDPIRLFIKGEPHKQSKLDEGRYRLIMSVSLVDQLVARVLFQNQNKREISLWREIPSKPGFGLSTDRDTREFLESLSKVVGCSTGEIISDWKDKIIPTDCSGFDWSVADWMLEDDMEVRNALTINNNQLTRHLRKVWLKCITNSVLCTSDGALYAQTYPGVQKSGSYNTSSSNSRIRVLAAYHCGADWAIAMGDDALESPTTKLEKYKELGFKVEVSSQLEFCSHVFEQEDLARPINVNKMLYRLIYGYNPACGNPEVLCNYLQAVASVLNELRHDPQPVAALYKCLVPGASTKEQ